MKYHRFRAVFLATTSAAAIVAVAPMAYAQAQQDQAASQTPSAPSQAAPKPQQVSGTSQPAEAEVVVTASRVIRNGNKSPTPLTTVTAQDLLKFQPASIAQGLANLPGMLGSMGQSSNVNTGGYDVVNLRGLGFVRNLILFDGLRVGPTQGATGSVVGGTNIDVIPQILLQRVDVVTGGASAVYGSDAVSGVVNFVPNYKLDHLKVDVSDGMTTYGMDNKANLSIADGIKFGNGRGHFEMAYGFGNNNGLLRSQNSWFNNVGTEEGSHANAGGPGSAANPYNYLTDARLGTSSFGGLITSGPLAGYQFAQGGTLDPFVAGTPTGTSGVQIGGDGDYYTGASLIPKQATNQLYSRLDYDFPDEIKAHLQGAYTNIERTLYQQSILLNKAIGYNNAYLNNLQPQYASTVASQLAANPTGSFNVGEMDSSLPNGEQVSDENYLMVDAGAGGPIGDKLDWKADYYHTISALRITNPDNISNARLDAALNAVTGPNGTPVCAAALSNPSAYGSCVPLDIFGSGAANQAAMNYIQQSTSQTQTYTQDAITGTVSGEPIDLPAGPLGVALNGEFRRETLGVSSDATPTDPVNCTGIQFNCTASTTPYFGGAAAALPTVGENVWEIAGETNVPLLKDLPLVKDLSTDLAMRYTDYSVSGTAVTWKAGAVWDISDEIKLRSTRSRDIRAPTLLDLYAPASVTTQNNFVDLRSGLTGNVNEYSHGNPGLVPERSDTFTAGTVLTPHVFPGFSLAVDYYDITVHKAIIGIDPYQPTTQDACIASGGTSSVCSLYARSSPTSFPTALYSEELNIAQLRTDGVDVEANYRGEISGHTLMLRGLLDWQPRLIYNEGPAGTLYAAGAADGLPGIPPTPLLKLVANASYDVTDSLNIGVQERWRGAMKQNASPTLVFYNANVDPIAYTDLNVSYVFNQNLTVTLTAQNLLNSMPPAFASSGGSAQINYLGGFAQGDDIEGRFVTLGGHFTF